MTPSSACWFQRAAIIKECGQDLVLETEHPVKQPSELAPGECLIKMEYAGVCHSDLHAKQGDWGRRPTLPLVGGHEGVGHIVAIGEHSLNKTVKIGNRVGLKWVGNTCMKCEMCRKGAESTCPLQKIHGYTIDGTFEDYIVSYVDYVTPIPEGLDSAAAVSILCAGVTVYKGLKQANTVVGNWVAIPGAGGGLGHLAVQYAVSMGLRVLAIDTGEQKKTLTMGLGAEKWIDFRETNDLVADVMAATDGAGPHAAIVATSTAAPFNQAIMYLRPTGTMVAVGAPAATSLNFPISIMVGKCLKIVGSTVGNRQDVIEALDIAARGTVKCHYELKALNDLNSIFTSMEQGLIAGRIIIKI